MKKNLILPNKNTHYNNSSGKPLPIFQINQETNHLITLITEEDHQTKKFYVIFHKIGIVDQIVDITSIEITIHYQVQTDQKISLKPDPIHTQGIDTLPMLDQEIPHKTEI